MSEPNSKRKPRTHRWFVIGGVLLAALLVLFVRYQRQEKRIQELRKDISIAGGSSNLADSIFVRLWGKLRGQPVQGDTFVRLEGPSFDTSWLQEHEDLSDIKIHYLELVDTQLDGLDLSKLAARHPLQWLRGQNIRNADALARALGDHPKLSALELPDSDLSDAGFCELPLEQLGWLDVSGSQVSLESLKQLGKCRRLTRLTIDGRQFDGEIKDMILNFNHPWFSLILRGPAVTDQHIELVREMDVGGNVLDLVLLKTSASPEAIKQLQSEFLPPFKVTVRN